MTKKKVLKWRLSNLPTVEQIQGLVNCKLITQEEARSILLSEEMVEDRDEKSLKSEIKFLRELVEKLSNSGNIVKYIETIRTPYYNYDWFQPYYYWCGGPTSNITNADSGLTGFTTGISSGTNTFSNGTVAVACTSDQVESSFSAIKTF